MLRDPDPALDVPWCGNAGDGCAPPYCSLNRGVLTYNDGTNWGACTSTRPCICAQHHDQVIRYMRPDGCDEVPGTETCFNTHSPCESPQWLSMQDMSDESIWGHHARHDECRIYPRPVVRCGETVCWASMDDGHEEYNCGNIFWCTISVITVWTCIIPFCVAQSCPENQNRCFGCPNLEEEGQPRREYDDLPNSCRARPPPPPPPFAPPLPPMPPRLPPLPPGRTGPPPAPRPPPPNLSPPYQRGRARVPTQFLTPCTATLHIHTTGPMDTTGASQPQSSPDDGDVHIEPNNAVMIYHSGEWRYVCDDGWGTDDADVVCRQLGFDSATSAPTGIPIPSNVQLLLARSFFWLDNVACTGSESRLSDCSASPWGYDSCGTAESAGAICSGGVPLALPPPPLPPAIHLQSHTIEAPTDATLLRGCTNTCERAFDYECDDGGFGAEFSSCTYGSDCFDCGPRESVDAIPSFFRLVSLHVEGDASCRATLYQNVDYRGLEFTRGPGSYSADDAGFTYITPSRIRVFHVVPNPEPPSPLPPPPPSPTSPSPATPPPPPLPPALPPRAPLMPLPPPPPPHMPPAPRFPPLPPRPKSPPPSPPRPRTPPGFGDSNSDRGEGASNVLFRPRQPPLPPAVPLEPVEPLSTAAVAGLSVTALLVLMCPFLALYASCRVYRSRQRGGKGAAGSSTSTSMQSVEVEIIESNSNTTVPAAVPELELAVGAEGQQNASTGQDSRSPAKPLGKYTRVLQQRLDLAPTMNMVQVVDEACERLGIVPTTGSGGGEGETVDYMETARRCVDQLSTGQDSRSPAKPLGKYTRVLQQRLDLAPTMNMVQVVDEACERLGIVPTTGSGGGEGETVDYMETARRCVELSNSRV